MMWKKEVTAARIQLQEVGVLTAADWEAVLLETILQGLLSEVGSKILPMFCNGTPYSMYFT